MSQSPLLDVKAVPGPQWRDVAGHFAKAVDAVDDELFAMGQSWAPTAISMLRASTRRKTGRTQEAWRADYNRSKLAVTVSNKRAPALFLYFGTRAHNIPYAFGRRRAKGRRRIFGTYGRFHGYFHPGQPRDENLVRAVERVSEQAKVDFTSTGARIVRRLITG